MESHFPNITASAMSSTAQDLCDEVINLHDMQSTQTLFLNNKNTTKKVAYKAPSSTTSSCKSQKNLPLLQQKSLDQKNRKNLFSSSSVRQKRDQSPKVTTIKYPGPNIQLPNQHQPIFIKGVTCANQKRHSAAVNTIISGPIRRNISFAPEYQPPKIKQINTKIQTASKTMFTLDKACGGQYLDSKTCGTQIFYFGKNTKIRETRSQGTLCADLYQPKEANVSYLDKTTFITTMDPPAKENVKQHCSKSMRWALSPHYVHGPDF